MQGFHLTLEGAVAADWIDDNGHMNVMWYMALFDRGASELLGRIGISRPSASGTLTLVAARTYIAHRRELFLDERYQLWSGLAGVSARHLTVVHRLASGRSIRATCDIRMNAFDPRRRAGALLGSDVLERARAYLVPGLPDRFGG